MRLIDADALKKSVPNTHVDIFENCRNCELLDDEQVEELIDNAPTIDAVPVVWCKDCVHGTDRTEEFGEGCVNPIACMMYSSDGEPDFFPKDNYCGFGERRDDD